MSNAPYLGLDIGLKRTGIAISESGLVARPLEIIENAYPHLHHLYQRVIELVKEYDVQTLVIGIPYTSDGDPTAQSERANTISDHIGEELTKAGLSPEIVPANEIGTTQDGEHLYPGLANDLAAATLILQEYLDSL